MRCFYGGYRIVGRKSRYSEDGKVVFTAGHNGLFVYSTITSKRIARLTKYEIKTFDLIPNQPAKVCILTLNGYLIVWDYSTLKVDVSRDLSSYGNTFVDMAINPLDHSIFISIGLSHGQSIGQIIKIRIPTLEVDDEFLIRKECSCALAISPSGQYLCILPHQKANDASVLSTTNVMESVSFSFQLEAKVVCFDRKDQLMAVGCNTGKILLFHEIEASIGVVETYTRKPSILHWHASAVTALQFSSDSHYLYSIGEEGVLVSWRLSDTHKSFVPRIGLNALSLDIHPKKESLFLISLQSNCFKMIDQTNQKAAFAVYGISSNLGDQPEKGTEACLQPKTGYLVLRSANCILQFYDLARDKHVSRLQVIPRMEVSKTKYKKPQIHQSYEPFLQHFAFNRSGSVLATVIIRSRLTKSELKTDIRFFHFDSANRSFDLNSEVLDPHKGGVASLAYSPTEDIAVSSSKRGDFRIWVLRSQSTTVSWQCRFIGSCKGYPLGACCFSHDGSVLAIAHSFGVALWDPTTLASLGEVPFPQMSGCIDLTHLQFTSQSDYLVACDPNTSILVVWDLQSLTIQWASLLSVDHLTTDQSSDKFAVALKHDQTEHGVSRIDGSSVIVFDPSSNAPYAVYSDFQESIASLHFALPNTELFAFGRRIENGVKHTHAPLVVMHASRQYTIETETGTLSKTSEEEVELEDINQMPSLIERAFGVNKRSEVVDEMDLESAHQQGVKFDLQDISKLPSHALPSVSVLCSNLLEQLFHTSNRT